MPPARPKPSDVAAETKKNEIPAIKSQYSHVWPCHSYLWHSPATQIQLQRELNQSLLPPSFSVHHADPVDFAIEWERSHKAAGNETRVPFICAANDRRPGGDWETGVIGYEERLCRRSNLSATLATPGPGSTVASNYPIPSEGGIYSQFVVVFRGPHDAYEKLPQWASLPVISIPAARWPKLSHGGTKYAFPLEREMVMNKIRAGLLICAGQGFSQVVIMDFGLGNSNRNPPQEIAEMWREVFMWDPEIRGHFSHVAFVFEDPYQSTTKLILDDIAKKSKGGSSSKKSKSSSSSSSSSSTHSSPSDYDIFANVFCSQAIQQEVARIDPRFSLSTLTS
ncbi:hypothetical protein PFICI_03163 [Pestalotiopsis fici W106-1]|uniref:Microbial-type PARG catalytic domain-containing protein n=1 Tax=Pestalotiopsis fici (strain W106-1 / CGMCC3.15140) TaxID=1229662 RepID=W3XGB2_PESFW|nr:uncharacterized protein PFICI_03163 [Pestalotiopsis fici W106-1]ETS85138.1 hypothetical protein PFICI_03163 [Pestalotiopsis fici W106-1]